MVKVSYYISGKLLSGDFILRSFVMYLKKENLLIGMFLMTFIRANGMNTTTAFTKDYFARNSAPHMVIFACWDDNAKMKFFQKDMLFSTRVSYQDIKHDIDMKSVLKVNYYRLGILLDLDCPKSEIIFKQFSNHRLPFNESYFWLIITKSTTVPTDILRELPLTIATEMTLAIRQNTTFFLYEVYNLSYRHGGRLNVTYLDYWNPDRRFGSTHLQYKYKRRQNFHGLTLNFSYLLNFPPVLDLETYLTTPIHPQQDAFVRYHYSLILQLRDTYNFSINLFKSDTWGYKINGTFTGILGQMIRGIVDISAAPFQLLLERLDVCEYTVQTYRVRPCFVFRHPKSQDVRNVFLKPFTDDVWYLILVVAFIYWLMLFLTVKIELHYNNDQPPTVTLDTNPGSETALITTAAICQQGLSDGPRIYSGRIVFLSLFLWGLLLFQFYSASVVGSLLSEPPRFIKTLKDLVHSNLEAGIEDLPYNHNYLRTTTDPVSQELNEKKIKPNAKRKNASYFSAEEGLKRVKKGGFAFHVDIATAYRIIRSTFTEDEICDLQEVQMYAVVDVATITSRHSPFKKMVTYGLRQIVEHGIPKRLRRIWHPDQPQCPESHNANPVPVALMEFWPALFSLFMGCAFAVFVMLMEMFVQRLERRKWKKSSLALNHQILNKHFIDYYNFSRKRKTKIFC